jgi:iron complex transport system ATP-binding protein
MTAGTMGGPPLLDMRRASFMRSGRIVLREVTLQIGRGECVAILGPNGSGKSTLVKAIAREVHPVIMPDASFTILGQDLWDVVALRAMLGVVSPDLLHRFGSEVMVRDVVLSGFFSSLDLWALHERVTPALQARVDGALDRLGIADLARRPLLELSSGEARRALLARALVHDPLTLVFDEPGTSLDLPAQRALRQTLSRLAGQGLGLVLVTHDLGDIVPEVSRVVFMAKGQVAGDGATSEMLTSERLSVLFGVPVEVSCRDGRWSAA